MEGDGPNGKWLLQSWAVVDGHAFHSRSSVAPAQSPCQDARIPEEAKDLSKCSKKGRSDDDERVSRRLPTQKIYIRHILYL